jgi:hypothetical protein
MTNGLSLEELMKEQEKEAVKRAQARRKAVQTRRNILKGKTGKYYMEIH